MKAKPILTKAGDRTVLINGCPPKVDIRVVAEEYYQQMLATPPTRIVTDAEIKEAAIERYPNGNIGTMLKQERFIQDVTWMRDKAITRTALPREVECNHDWKEHTFDTKPDQRFCPLCKRQDKYDNGKWIVT